MNSRRYYTNQVGGIPVADQEEMAKRDGLENNGSLIYQETKRSFPRQRNKCFESFRPRAKDEHVWVSDFIVLVPRHKYLKAVLAALKKRKAYIYEGRTGRASRNARDYAAMLHDALDYWKRGRLPHHLAVKYGRMGGEQFAENLSAKPDERMPKFQALKIWRDPGYETADDAVEAMNSEGYREDWSRSAAYRELKSRGFPSGPRPQKRT